MAIIVKKVANIMLYYCKRNSEINPTACWPRAKTFHLTFTLKSNVTKNLLLVRDSCSVDLTFEKKHKCSLLADYCFLQIQRNVL